MRLVKMHGIGNDYVFADCIKEKMENPAELAVRISDRHFGVGSDGLILICPSERADYEMRVYNADGSYARMCGNGIRCVENIYTITAMSEGILLRSNREEA